MSGFAQCLLHAEAAAGLTGCDRSFQAGGPRARLVSRCSALGRVAASLIRQRRRRLGARLYHNAPRDAAAGPPGPAPGTNHSSAHTRLSWLATRCPVRRLRPVGNWSSSRPSPFAPGGLSSMMALATQPAVHTLQSRHRQYWGGGHPGIRRTGSFFLAPFFVLSFLASIMVF